MMPPIEWADLRQPLVVWKFSGQDRQAEIIVHAPIQTYVRWNDKRTQPQDAFENVVAYEGTVVMSISVPDMTLCWLGKKADLPNPPDNLYQLTQSNATPDITGRRMRYEYKFMRYRDRIGTVLTT